MGEPRARVYCFAHAGGSAGEFRAWDGLAEDVRVVGVERPGRGARFGEPAAEDLLALAADLAGTLALDLPFGLFGHSFGALLAFEVAHALRRSGRATPDRLWLSSFPSPDVPRPEPEVRHLPDADLLRTLHVRHGGIPGEVLDNPELLAVVATYVRADYAAMETYRFRHDRDPLPCAVDVLAGADEHDLHDRLPGWSRHTTGRFSSRLLPGGHFYLRQPANRQAIVSSMGEAMISGISTTGVH
ncbi:Linear gramicidin dehydrogenase LgrE [Nonomuraea coxensis DSM 45129]|uniref:Linear gramicidin dehydrogenase LgrE n=1 Tax=Nonomuraea coxensis DSM 45129 TaxID=1122611 RepID=A0ABX8UBN7_9ACTN|nr:alpha/beta fold hydrolase [Nonomuraea coxensis]QYC44244.1 Linear gramicidin dehydrogenase LgrE [Nonomuraea coxensis DSM 45129]